MNLLTLLSLAAALCPGGSALQAVDQSRLNRPDENPAVPSAEFLDLIANPRVLIAFGSGAEAQSASSYADFIAGLQQMGARVTTITVGETTAQVGSLSYYDKIMLIGSASLPLSKADANFNGKKVLDWLEEDWLLPTSLNSQVLGSHSDNRKPLLPRSLFVFAGGEAGTPGVGHTVRILAGQLGLWFPTNNTAAVAEDPFAEDSASGVRGVVPSNLGTQFFDRSKAAEEKKCDFKGVPHRLATANPTLLPILQPPVTTHALLDSKYEAAADGTNEWSLVSAFQGLRSWNRVIFAGQSDLCAGGLGLGAGNGGFCRALVEWGFHRRAVRTLANWRNLQVERDAKTAEFLGVSDPFHHRILRELLVAVDVYELSSNGASYAWVPTTEPAIELSFTMLYPYERSTMYPYAHLKDYARPGNGEAPSELLQLLATSKKARDTIPGGVGEATHLSHFQNPEQHGVFKVVLKHVDAAGMTPIWHEALVPLRNMKHNDYERFIPCAWGYYLSLLSTLFGLCAVTLLVWYPSSGRHLLYRSSKTETKQS